jgi:hypothetical protein
MSLLLSTKALLRRHRRAGKSLADIHRELGGKIEREWFYKFAANRIPDPSVNRIQTLHDCLKNLDSHAP